MYILSQLVYRSKCLLPFRGFKQVQQNKQNLWRFFVSFPIPIPNRPKVKAVGLFEDIRGDVYQ